MKRGMNKFFSILLVLCMLISMVPMTAFAATPDVLYLKPNANWLGDGARFAAYFYGNGESWVSMTDSDGDGIYECSVPSGCTSVIFCRMNPDSSTNDWGNKWNQSSDLTIPTDGTNCFTIADGTWDAGGGSWSAVSFDYYLFGFINGANYGCEEDAANLGEYKFSSAGKLSATFDAESYIGVKTGDNANWYMTEGFQGTSKTLTLYNTNSGIANPEKAYVPAGIKVNFTLTRNTDGTLQLKYSVTKSTCKHLFYTNGKCNACATACTHSYSGGVCTVCGQAEPSCSHSYTSKVTTAATCTTAGEKTYTCSKCSDTYTETIAATGHKYSSGACTVCGAYDPSYTVTDTGFVLVTDPTQITAGGKFVIVANNSGTYQAMGTTIASGKFAAVTVTVDGRIVKGSDLPIWTIEKVTGGIAISNDNGYLAYNSSTNFKYDTAAYTWTVNGGESGYILHNTDGSRGIYYQISSSKFGAYATTNVNSASYVSNLQLYKYQVGSQGCSHSYTSKVTTEATCTKAGVKTFTCSLCGNSYTESIAATGHSYTDGSCTVCGAADPNADLTYYLVGFINGANHGCEEDASNMGSYKFGSTGKLTATFTDDSYVFVKTEGNTKWFMAESYCTDTTCKLVSGGTEKLWVPGGIKVSFTLTENSDGSLTLKYTKTASSCQHLYYTEGVCNACGKACTHSYSNGKCTVCGMAQPACSHSYTSKVTTAATCTTAGEKTYTCSKCSDTYTETIAATGHKYSSGACTVCGAYDPSYTVTDTGFVLVTDPTQITAGGKFVIVANNSGTYQAMGTTIASGKFAAVTVTVDGRIVKGSDLPIWTIEKVTGGIAISNDNGYLAYNSSTNFKYDTAAYTWTVNGGESGYILHNTDGSRGIYYQISSSKFGAYATTNVNSASYVSNLQLYKYQVGSQGCSHSYTSKVTTEATCTKAGVKTFTCSLCGNSYTESIAATGHSYTDGSCTVCGAADPNADLTYYLVGFINGANHGCEEDASNMGSYKFGSTGKLTATFTDDSYVFVKTEGNTKWFMAESYCTDTTCKLVSGGTEKLWVPGGIKVSFTLTENSDGSLTLKYTKTASSCQHLYYTEGVCNACGKACTHSYSNGKCTVCGMAQPACSHSYTSKVTTAATCTTAGEKTYTCSKCSDTYTETIAATGHKYSSGACTVCGAYDPSYTVTDTGFVLVTDPTQITAGGKFVIVANNSGTYQAMGTTIASGKFAAVTVTVDGRIVKGSDLPIWTIEKVTGGIAISNDNGYLAYNSSTNFKYDTAAYTWTVNGGESGYILHNTDGSRGIYYQISSSKFGAYATTNVNSASYVSNLQLYKYQVGSQGCSHSYTSKVTTEATCTKAGVKTFTCSLCGNSYTESIAATGHSYTDGSCTVCGAADPNADLTYYLVGFINGANHGCEEDASNMGSYKFGSTGKLTATFTDDSYVFVKTEGNTKWFMAESYCTDTTCKLVSGGTEKLWVPGGIKVSFTLTENSDGSLTLKYTKTASSCQHLYYTEGVCNACGKACTHSYSNGKCTVCGMAQPSEPVTDTGFVLVTDASQITAGGKFVIVANNNGTYQAMGTTLASGKFAAVTVTVDGQVVTGTDLPVWTIEKITDGIAISLDGSYLSYNSSTNFKMDTAAYAWTVTEGSTGFILDAASTTRGIYYSISAAKFGAYATSSVNSSSYVSNLQLYKYQVGTQGCSHSYTSKVTTEATCDAAGVKTFTCSLCGDTYTESIAATGHSYTSGTCSICGAADPGYSLNYYLVGFINGANHGCEEDSANMGSYKFGSTGKLTATFTQDSFVFVKTENNEKWYLAESYCTDTTCKLVQGGNEKLLVPGGIKVTFTLTENTDGSLTIQYTKTASSCQHLTHSQEGVCNACGKTVSHSWSSGACSVCGLKCSHSAHSQEGICATCGVAVSHSFSGNTCTICGKVTAASTVKVHFVDAVVWQNVTAYIWKTNAKGNTDLTSWPGEILNRDANGYFTIELDYKPVSGESLGFIFTNFNGGQTADTIVNYSTLSSGEIWIKPNNWTNGEGKYDCYVTSVESSMVLSPEIHGNSVTFRYENSSASKVYLAGSMNGWSTSANKLTKGSDGIWSTTMSLDEGVYEYKFVVDGEWILDPKNGLIGGYDGNSLAIVGNAGSNSASNITVKLHFYRESGDYANWDAWMWSNTNEGQGCTFYDDPVYKGKTATFTIPGGTNSYVNYKIRKTDWSDEEFYTRSFDISNIKSGTVHFFLNSGSANGSLVYGNDVIKMGKPTYANLDYNSGNIWVKTPLPVSGDFTKVFSVVNSDGSASGISVTGVTMDNNGYSLSLSRKPALIELHNLVVKCGTTVGIETDGLFYSGGFANDYTYYGNDLGATWSKKSTTFKVWAPTATGVSVILYRGGNHGGDDWISTTPMTLGEKGVYSLTIKGDLNGTYYNFLVNFPDYTTEATDPYAKTTGANGDRGMIINMDAYDPEGWDRDLSPNQGLKYTDAIIYEMHIREMTIDSTSGVKSEWRGKYLGLTQEGTNYQGRATALDHIKELGVTHVQLMPTYDHAGVDEYHLTDWQQYAWGYNPKNFNVPEGSFATDPYNGEVRVTEMKQMVQAFHSKGINVVMDVVYNHTYDGGNFCYNKIVPNYFSRFWGENNWSNGSGVGNDFATERSMARNYIVDSIFYWVEEYHIDGFRFDLAGLIDIQTINEVISTVQARYPYVIFYGEGWAVGGTAIQDGHWTATKENAWQTGSMAFYNDTFRNDIAGDNGNNWGFATGDSGKADKIGDYFRASNGWSSSPSQTINYVSCHDNYTLIDKIIISRNGAYWDQMVKMNNMSAAIYMLAQGIPYIYSGEELLREKKDEWGNRYHNTYDSSDYVTKIRWDDLVNKEFAQVTDDYYAGLVNFRKNHAALRCPGGGDAWGYTQYHKINDHCILFYVSGYPNYECSDGIVIIYNANEGTQWLNIYDYGVPYGNWQATIHGMTAGVNPLWSTYDGSVGVEGLSTTVLVLGDLVHEESVYNNQSYSCSHSYHSQSGLCWDCGAKVDHYFVNGYCNHCNLAQSASGTMTLYFDNSASQWGNVYAYAWTETGGRTTTYTDAWPGTQMTSVGGNVFAVTIPCAANNVIFTDNYGNQTVTQGLIKNDNGVLTSNLYYSSSASWGNYTAACTHTSHNSDGICSNCGVNVGHDWNNGYCAGCKTSCSHTSHNVSGYCTNCSANVGHSWSNGSCTGCSKTCSHSWSNGKCTNCSMTCSHSGHDQNGNCYTCGYSVGHSYYGGLCSTCGSYKKGYIESQSYYLVGYINGSNYGCEENYQTLGSYQFTSGKLTATFSSDSYVYVKTGDNASFYMTDGYQEGATSVTLHDSRTVAGDKLFVPGGKEVTFTLSVNSSNNTMVLSYTVEDPVCSHSYTSKVTTAATCEKAGVKTFTCSKCGDSYTQSIAAIGHNYTSKVTTAATCTKEGVETYTCSNCADSYTQIIPVIAHNYQDGNCTGCGALDPNYTVTDTGFVLVTNASQITAGGKFIIVANNNGAYQAMGTTLASGKFAPVTVTVDGRMVTGSDLPIWTIEKTGNGIAIRNDGGYLAYNSSTNFKLDTAAYTWTVSEGEDGYILNAADTTRGIYYQLSSGKFGAYSTSYASSSSYISNLQLYKYQVGTQGCSHSYTSKVTTEAACEKSGIKTFTCSLCNHSYTETIPATGHSYTDGSCTVCGAADPNADLTYYLVGYINGANHGCEEDASNMGSYRFSGGKLTTTFTSDSYVFVKTEGNGKWFMTESYCTDTTCKLVEGGSEKLFVPGGIKVTFTLTENADGSLTLKYTKTASSCQHLTHSQDGICNACGKTVSHSYENGSCTVCGGAEPTCSHSYTEKITTAATCTTVGEKTFTCSKCGDSYTQSIAATGHKYSGGSCSVCGAYDPNYSVTDTGFVLVTDPSQITAGGKFILVANNGGTYQAMGTTLASGKFVAVTVTVDGRMVTGSDLPVWTVETVNGGVALNNGGGYLAYNSSTNFKLTEDAYTWTVNGGESGYMLHNTDGSRGIYYQLSSGKFGAYATSNVNSASYVSNLQLYKYQVGTQGCSHNYSSKITTAATCTTSGVKTLSCVLCGHSYTETIAATGHSYADGSCSVCGAADPSAPVDHTYYLVGYINGADCGLGDDLNNTGNYKFVDGKVTVTFTEESYVAVKVSDNSAFYMTNGWVGAVTSATLYKFTDPNATSANKLMIPGGQTVTFTLSENWDGNLNISYVVESSSCVHISHNTDGICTTCGATVEHTFSNGVCTVCYQVQEGYDPFDYYLYGYINGANYGCEEDAVNLGEYKFVDGTLTVTFTEDSYIGVKEVYPYGKFGAEVIAWYVTDGWLGNEITNATLYKSDAVTAGDKLLVPGGVELSFTLAKNDDGSLALRYTKNGPTACSHSYTSKVTTAATCTVNGVKTYTCSKCGDSYTEAIAATGHKYSSGSCSVCGAYDPNYSVTDTGFVLVTDPSQITAGGKFILVANNGGTYQAMGTTLASGKFAAVTVTVDGRVVSGNDLPVWTIEAVSGGITIRNDSGYLTYNSSTNFKYDTAAYTWTVNGGESGYILHNTEGARGIYFQISTSKFGAYATSNVNSASYVSNLQLYKYQVGTQGCSHNYTSQITTAATCTANGVKTFTCSLCNHSYTEVIAATGHSYANGSCTVCGAADPSTPVDYTYYLVGYINGTDYGCEGDWENMGNYKFVDGKLVATFTEDSYIFIKTEGNGKWLMADAYCEATTCTFAEGGTEKMRVPGGVKITFTLTENGDGSVTLSYVTSGPVVCEHSYTSKVTTAATCTKEGVKTYTCSKCNDSYTEAIAVIAHSYANGSCTACGAMDPGYSVTDTGFVLVTDPSQITAGGKFVIVANNNGTYQAMNTTLTSGKFAPLTVTVDGRVVTGNDLPAWTVEGVDGGIVISLDGKYLVYNSSTNFKLADEPYVWTVTEGNGGFILNAADTARGIYYSISAAKFGAYSTSYVNSSSYVSGLQLYKYQVGTQGCSHSYTSKITTAATCTANGVKTFTCSLCNHGYTQMIAATGHSYSNGSCTVCGAADPSTPVDYTYYLVGYINGADYGCEGDWENMGNYKFVNGKLVATFTEDSYIFIKTEGNGKWLLASAYCEQTSCTFAEGGTEKMFVPGGVKLTFTLKENADGSVTVSYTKEETVCSHSYTSKVTTAATCTTVGIKTFTCSKCGDAYTESIPATGHSYSGGKCTNCGAAEPTCSHSYTSKVTTAATCTTVGIKTYTCSKCADSYTESIPATGHSFVDTVVPPTCENNGYTTHKCSVCGVSNPNTDPVNPIGHNYAKKVVTAPTCTEQGYTTYTCSNCGNVKVWDYTNPIGHNFVGGTCTDCGASSVTTYYLVGYINGADYGCEADYQNMGQYKFVNGKLTATFTQDSYIFVKTEGNGKWLLADAYCTDTSCTFAEGGTEKMFVPGGVQVTFTLTENANGSVTVSYTTSGASASTVPTLKLKAPTLEFKDMICVVAFYTAENTQNVVEMGMLTYSTKVAAANIATAEHVTPGATYDSASGRYYSRSHGIHAKYLGDTVYVAIYAKLADGTYAYSPVAGYSAVQYATSQLKNSTDTKLKQLVVAMLNYGAEAQLYFGHNVSSLANASLTADQKALPAAYSSSMVGSVPTTPAAKQGSFVSNSGYSSRKPAISFEGAFCINYFFTPKYAPDNGITLYYWNQSDYNANSVLTTSNATGKIKLEGSGTGEYRGDITGISAKELADTVFVAAVYNSGGTTWASGVLGYSIGAYCSSQASKGGDIAALAKATAVYGYHAKQYFG